MSTLEDRREAPRGNVPVPAGGFDWRSIIFLIIAGWLLFFWWVMSAVSQ
jgi:hypothetical protein